MAAPDERSGVVRLVDSSGVSPRLANIRLHPIKSLDPVSVSQARINPSGGLEYDRAWALYSVDGKWVNGKRTAAIHTIRAKFADDLGSVTISAPTDARNLPIRTFAFPDAHEDAAEWFSVFFQQRILVRHSIHGFPDDTIANGPTIVSKASLQAICEWFAGVTLDEARRRFRTSLEIDGVPAFWEDQLFGESRQEIVRFRIGEVSFEGSNPCERCPVPPRNPFTGETRDGFQKRFAQLRETNLPPWAPRRAFDHFYRFTTNTRVPPSETGKLLRAGDVITRQH